MSRFIDYNDNFTEVKKIMENILTKFPQVFEDFKMDGVEVILSEKKKTATMRYPIAVKSVTYPFLVYVGKPYIFEVNNGFWVVLSDAQKNMAVFQSMCVVPFGGFDEASESYAKKKKPDYTMYRDERKICGGSNWQYSSDCADPLECDQSALTSMDEGTADAIDEDEDIVRSPVTEGEIEDLGDEVEEEAAVAGEAT